MSESVYRQAAIDATKNADVCVSYTLTESIDDIVEATIAATKRSVIASIETIEVVQPEIMPEGTLRITVNADVASIDRILLSQEGTHSGDLYYKDAQSEHKTCNGCVHWFKRYKAPCASCSRNGSFIDRWEEGE